MKLKNITPGPMVCIIGSCPAIYETDRGTLIIVGKRLAPETVATLLPGKVADDEEAIEIPFGLLPDNYIK